MMLNHEYDDQIILSLEDKLKQLNILLVAIVNQHGGVLHVRKSEIQRAALKNEKLFFHQDQYTRNIEIQSVDK